MKIPAARAEGFSKKPEATCLAVLVYGPDEGLIQERCQSLISTVVDNPRDPFRVVDMTGGQLAKDPARLMDEATALSMTGGRRAVRIRSANDSLAEVFKGFFQSPGHEQTEALIVVQAGDLPSRSRLRKIFESEAKKAAALPCYPDDRESLPGVINQVIQQEGFFLNQDALAYLVANLGADRQLTRQELVKLCLYKKSDTEKNITLDDARAVIGDSSAVTVEALNCAVIHGNLQEVEINLQRVWDDGQMPITILRSLSRSFQRLHQVSILLASGQNLDLAIKSLRPPLFWKESNSFKRQVKVWSLRQLETALSRLFETENACKAAGARGNSLCARTLAELAARSPMRGKK